MATPQQGYLFKGGGENTKFYHRVANECRAINTIGKLVDDEGTQAKTFHQLVNLVITHFGRLFKAPPGENLTEIIRVAGHFPRYVEQDIGEGLLNSVTMGELEAIIKWFKRDNNPRLDGWSIEFYIAFFDIIGQELLQIIEDFHISR